MSVLVSQADSTWITPPEIIKLVTDVIGVIDLDPASSATANKIINASNYYTKEQDALSLNWKCDNFFLNPPYGKIGNKSQAGVFAEYAISQYKQGYVDNGGIILLHDRSGYSWFENLALQLPCVTLRERIRFINPNTMAQGDQAKTAQTLFVVGTNFRQRFIDTFKELGRIYIPSKKK